MIAFLLWILLLVVCWPLALLALVLYPFVWLILLPFRLVGIAVGGVFAFLKALTSCRRGCWADGLDGSGAGPHVMTDPAREIGLRQLALAQRPENASYLLLGRVEVVAIDGEKDIGEEEGGALVPVDEWMVADQRVGVRGSEVREIGIVPVCPPVPRARKGRFQEAGVAKPRRATMLPELEVVDRLGDPTGDPDGLPRRPAHPRARSRRAFR